MTTVDAISLDLPEADLELISDPDDTQDRRWLTSQGMAIALTVVPPDEPADVDPLSLDMAVGATLRRYADEYSGIVENTVKTQLPGFTAARAASVVILSSNDEPTRVAVMAGQAPDRDIVVLQLTWPLSVSEVHEPLAEQILTSFALGTTQQA